MTYKARLMSDNLFQQRRRRRSASNLVVPSTTKLLPVDYAKEYVGLVLCSLDKSSRRIVTRNVIPTKNQCDFDIHMKSTGEKISTLSKYIIFESQKIIFEIKAWLGIFVIKTGAAE